MKMLSGSFGPIFLPEKAFKDEKEKNHCKYTNASSLHAESKTIKRFILMIVLIPTWINWEIDVYYFVLYFMAYLLLL